MTGAGVATFDLVVLAVIIISALWGLSRGLVREILGVAAWVGAGAATYYGLALVKPFARQLITSDDPMIPDTIAAIVLFLVALILLSLLSGAISLRVRDSALSMVDRTLGLIYGVARGAALICLAWLAYSLVAHPPATPEALAASRSWPWIERGSAWLKNLVPIDEAHAGEASAAEARRRAEQAATAERVLRTLNSPPPKPASREQPAYGAQDRRDLDRLIEGQRP